MQKTTQRKVAEKSIARVTDYKRLFNTKQGERVLHDMMQTHHMFGTTFDKTNRDQVIFREGERNVILRILKILDTDGELLRKHLHNHLEESKL